MSLATALKGAVAHACHGAHEPWSAAGCDPPPPASYRRGRRLSQDPGATQVGSRDLRECPTSSFAAWGRAKHADARAGRARAFREETRELRMQIDREAQRRFERKVSWA
jgi:hypothetical protein